MLRYFHFHFDLDRPIYRFGNTCKVDAKGGNSASLLTSSLFQTLEQAVMHVYGPRMVTYRYYIWSYDAFDIDCGQTTHCKHGSE